LNNFGKTMLTSKTAPGVPLTDMQDAKNTIAAGPTVKSDGADDPPQVALGLLILMTFHILSDRIGGQVSVVKNSLQQKKDDIDSCTALLNGLSSWNTPPLVPKDPADPQDPVNEDRVKKTEALYLNGISIPDSDYDAVKYDFADGPKPAYSALPIPQISSTDFYGLGKLDPVIGQVYDVYNVPNPAEPNKIITDQLVFSGPTNPSYAPKSPLDLKTQSGTDFSNSTPGDLVQDLDTGKYYRISNAKTGVEVSGYPLQKFVQSPDSNVIASLNAQISQRINAVSDLTQTTSLDLQKLQGFFTNVVNMCTELIATLTTASTGIINKT
jgi:hypothetical protein